jgi:hypothetical protein
MHVDLTRSPRYQALKRRNLPESFCRNVAAPAFSAAFLDDLRDRLYFIDRNVVIPVQAWTTYEESEKTLSRAPLAFWSEIELCCLVALAPTSESPPRFSVWMLLSGLGHGVEESSKAKALEMPRVSAPLQEISEWLIHTCALIGELVDKSLEGKSYESSRDALILLFAALTHLCACLTRMRVTCHQ